MTTRPLPDRWHTRDLPFLIEVARALDEHRLPEPEVVLGLSEPDTNTAWHALREAGYLRVLDGPRRQGDGIEEHIALTERGRRAVGLWPDEEKAADALVDLLNQAADVTTDEDDAGNLRKAGRLLRSVPSAILADVTAAWIRQQTGMS